MQAMSLFLATLLTGLVLIAFGGHFAWHGARSETSVKAFPRSSIAAYVLFGAATLWFIYHLSNLGPSDFGAHKQLLMIVSAVGAVAAFVYVPDFLAVRGLAGLFLLIGAALLDAAYMEIPQSRLFLVVFVYLAVVTAILLGAQPYRLRDFFDWLYKGRARPRLFGGLFLIYGIILVIVAVSY